MIILIQGLVHYTNQVYSSRVEKETDIVIQISKSLINVIGRFKDFVISR